MSSYLVQNRPHEPLQGPWRKRDVLGALQRSAIGLDTAAISVVGTGDWYPLRSFLSWEQAAPDTKAWQAATRPWERKASRAAIGCLLSVPWLIVAVTVVMLPYSHGSRPSYPALWHLALALLPIAGFIKASVLARSVRQETDTETGRQSESGKLVFARLCSRLFILTWLLLNAVLCLFAAID